MAGKHLQVGGAGDVAGVLAQVGGQVAGDLLPVPKEVADGAAVAGAQAAVVEEGQPLAGLFAAEPVQPPCWQPAIPGPRPNTRPDTSRSTIRSETGASEAERA